MSNPSTPIAFEAAAQAAGMQVVDVSDALQANRELLASNEAWRFPSGPAPTLYNGRLEHVPFRFSGDFRFSRKEATTIKELVTGDDAPEFYNELGQGMRMRTIPAQDCIEAKVSILTIDKASGKGTLGEPKPAQLTGTYLLNQLKGLIAQGQTGMLYGAYLWTIRRNSAFTTIGGQHPYMLAIYDPSLDEQPATPF